MKKLLFGLIVFILGCDQNPTETKEGLELKDSISVNFQWIDTNRVYQAFRDCRIKEKGTYGYDSIITPGKGITMQGALYEGERIQYSVVWYGHNEKVKYQGAIQGRDTFYIYTDTTIMLPSRDYVDVLITNNMTTGTKALSALHISLYDEDIHTIPAIYKRLGIESFYDIGAPQRGHTLTCIDNSIITLWYYDASYTERRTIYNASSGLHITHPLL